MSLTPDLKREALAAFEREWNSLFASRGTCIAEATWLAAAEWATERAARELRLLLHADSKCLDECEWNNALVAAEDAIRALKGTTP